MSSSVHRLSLKKSICLQRHCSINHQLWFDYINSLIHHIRHEKYSGSTRVFSWSSPSLSLISQILPHLTQWIKSLFRPDQSLSVCSVCFWWVFFPLCFPPTLSELRFVMIEFLSLEALARSDSVWFLAKQVKSYSLTKRPLKECVTITSSGVLSLSLLDWYMWQLKQNSRQNAT